MADDDRKRRNEQGGPGTAVITKTKPQTKRPNMYRVLILNDDYTPMEFVVMCLKRFFRMDLEQATRRHQCDFLDRARSRGCQHRVRHGVYLQQFHRHGSRVQVF